MPRAEIPALFAQSHVLVNNMRAGAPDKVVYEAAASCLPVLASNPVFDDLLPDDLRFDRDDPESLADAAARRSTARAAPTCARSSPNATRSSTGPTPCWLPLRAHERRTVLHLQKVAGISGSEAHLLALLPKLRERGWDVRMLMLHENEPGAWEFARALTARGVPLDSIPLRADVDPIAFMRLSAYLARARPAILHTHLVHADAYGLLAGTAARVPVRFSTKHGFNEFREAPYFGLADRSVARAGARAHRDLARSRALPRGR